GDVADRLAAVLTHRSSGVVLLVTTPQPVSAQRGAHLWTPLKESRSPQCLEIPQSAVNRKTWLVVVSVRIEAVGFAKRGEDRLAREACTGRRGRERERNRARCALRPVRHQEAGEQAPNPLATLGQQLARRLEKD